MIFSTQRTSHGGSHTSQRPRAKIPRAPALSQTPRLSHGQKVGEGKRLITRKKTGPKVKITVLGGLEEVGRNMTVLEYENDIIIIDMGLQFPEEDTPGIDYIIPNISSLKPKISSIRGVIITHGHFDHIGAIPHLMPELGNPPLFTGRLSAGLIEKRQREHRHAPKLNIQIINEKTRLQLGKFRIEFFRVNHNIPDSFAAVATTPLGTIIHTGDFKIDKTPVNDKPMDLEHVERLGKRGVLALLADSTHADKPGCQISESDVGVELDKLFTQVKGRIIIGTFASLLSRVQQIITLTKKYNRKLVVFGRSMRDNIEIAHQLGYLTIPQGVIVMEEDLHRLPDEKLVVLCTGAQGEQRSTLMRTAMGEHPFLDVKKGDTVIFSSSVIPGNERTVQTLKDSFARKGANIFHYKFMDIHAGGHAHQEDLKHFIQLLKPKYFIPIEANRYLLDLHGKLAISVGVPEKNVFVADNGQIIEITKTGGRITEECVPADYVMVDGLGVGDVSEIVLRDRQVLAEDGMLVAIVTIDSRTGKLLGNPDLISRGFVHMKENREFIEQIRMKAKRIATDHDPSSPPDDNYIKNKLRNELGQFLFMKTKRRPMILPVVIKV
jgi:ribonuclease J